MTNNCAERAVRGVACGRKSWLFAGSDRGADRAAIMLTLIMTARLNDVDPKAWLAASMGMGAYGVAGGVGQVALFTGIYLVICLGSIACWAYAGSCMQGLLLVPRRLRWFNRAMALLLLLSAAYLVRSA